MKKRSKVKRRTIPSQGTPRWRAKVGAVSESVLIHDSELGADSTTHSGEETLQMLEGHGQGNLSQAKAQWLFGEWSALAATDLQALRHNPERDRYALLAASAHQQLGDHGRARKYTRLALRWGCSRRVVAQILIAGVHNTLGRAAALARNDVRAARHFREAVAVVSGTREAELLSHARSVREMAKLGLLPQAASLVDQELAKTRKISERPEQTRARIRVLETELELLHHELSFAQQRQQLYQKHTRAENGPASQDDTGWLKTLRNKSVSQLGQDLWVLEKTGYKRGGFFVEFGASDGVLLSNTWLLEKEFGWRGICAEPNRKFYEQLKRNRACLVSNACIGATTGDEVEFVLADVYSSMTKYANTDMHSEKRNAYAAVEGNIVRLETMSLNDFLIRHAAPRTIDYLSIDTEGSEFEILQAFPFDEWDIRLVTVEHNFTGQREKVFELLRSKGYERREAKFDDWYFKR